MISKYLEMAIKQKSPYVRPEHIEKVLRMSTHPQGSPMYNVVMHAASHPNASDENLTHALTGYNEDAIQRAIEHKNLKPHHIEEVLRRGLHQHIRHLAYREDLEPHHIDKIIEKDKHSHSIIAQNKSTRENHLHTLLEKWPNSGIMKASIAKHSNTSDEDLKKIASEDSYAGSLAKANLKKREGEK